MKERITPREPLCRHPFESPIAFSLIVLVPLFFILCLTAGAQEQRVALIIGNGKYQHNATLANPPNDATDMATALRKDGFTVTLLTDASRKDMEQAVRAFGNSLKNPEAVGMFYYSGHGAQADGVNYLIPVDADIQNGDELTYNAVDAESILAKMRSAGNKINIVVLDACRDSPFPGASRSVDKGLAVVKVKVPESVIVYATDPGSTASDGTGRNSPFTKAFLENMDVPNQDITQMMKRVTSRVQTETGGKQTPWVSTNLTRDFAFASASASTTVSSPKLSVTRSYGSIAVTAATQGTLFLDGTAVGDIPAGANAKLDSVEVGSRSLELRYADGHVERLDATVEAGAATTVSFSYRIAPPETQGSTGESATGQIEPNVSSWQAIGSTWQGTDQFSSPSDVAVDSTGRIYVADSGNKRVVRIDDMNGTNWTVSKAISSADALRVNASGQLFVASAGRGGSQILRLDDINSADWTMIGGSESLFNEPHGIATDESGRIYIADSRNNQIVRIDDTSGTNWTTLGSGGNGTNQFVEPYGVAVDTSGHIYITDSFNNRIVRIDDMSGTNWTTLGTAGNGTNQFSLPGGVAVDSRGRIYVADYGNNRIVRIDDMSGTNWTVIGSLGSELYQFNSPKGIALDATGSLYVADTGNDRIVRIVMP